MSEVLINLDDALAGAAKHLGTTGKEETVNTALREFDQRRRRREAFDELAAMAETGMFDELLDKRNRGGARPDPSPLRPRLCSGGGGHRAAGALAGGSGVDRLIAGSL